jgi:REP element-mobilizing transposase RayT
MPRMPRVHIEGSLEYVACRRDNDQLLFRDDKDYQTYLEALKKYQSKYCFKLYAFVLLPNHLHLLVELVGGRTISQLMHGLNSHYNRYFNARYHQKGHLFQERYRRVIVEKQYCLAGLTTYIHRNPSVLGLVKGPAEYSYSSCGGYLGLQTPAGFPEIASVEVLAKLQGRTYPELLAAPQEDPMILQLRRKAVIGSEEFVRKVQWQMERQRISEETEQEETIQGASHKKLMWSGSVAIVLLGILITTLYTRTMGLTARYQQELGKKEIELQSRLMQEKERFFKDVDEKYRADQVSYEAMVKRLEIEKKRGEELELKLKLEGGKS